MLSMNNWKSKVIWVTLIIIGLVGIFWLLNFKLARNTTRVESQISTYSSGFEKGQSLPVGTSLRLVVEGQDSLAQTVAKRLEREFLDGPITRIDREQTVQTGVDQFQVVVTLVGRQVFWSPFYAQSSLNVNFAFSSNGDLSWRDQEVMAFTSEQGQIVAVGGDLQLRDTTFGLLSWPAYRTHLADELAWRIEEAILKALDSPTNPALGNP